MKKLIRTEILKHLDSIEESVDGITKRLKELEVFRNRITDLEDEVKSLSFLVDSPFKFKAGDMVVVDHSTNMSFASSERMKIGPTVVLSRSVDMKMGCPKKYEVFDTRKNKKMWFSEHEVSLSPKE